MQLTEKVKNQKSKSFQLNFDRTMGNQQSGSGGEGGKKNEKGEKKKYEPPVPTRVGKKRKKTKGPDTASKMPMVTPHTKCRLRLLKQERIKDYLLMEEEFIRNQERLKPQEEKNEEERSKVDDLRGTPMSVGSLVIRLLNCQYWVNVIF